MGYLSLNRQCLNAIKPRSEKRQESNAVTLNVY